MLLAWAGFFNNSKVLHSNKFFRILTSEEIIKTETVIIKIVQKESFSRPKSKCLKALQCMQMEFWKLKWILMREDISRFQYPIVLPYDHSEVEKLIQTSI